MKSPIQYLKSNSLEAWNLPNAIVGIFKKGEGPNGTLIGSYSRYEATNYGVRDATPEEILETYLRPIVENYVNRKTKESSQEVS